MDKKNSTDSINANPISGVLRSPNDCFENLEDYPFQSRYTFVDNLRVHYLDEGDKEGKVVVMLHGLPTWSYLYRHMIPYFVAAGYRVIVPDLIGYGKSDKPRERKHHSYSNAVKWMEGFLFDQLKLTDINFILQDWGGLIGLRIVAEQPKKFTSVIAMNTAFPRAEGFNPVFYLWRLFSSIITLVPYSKLIRLGIFNDSGSKSLKAYDAPFPAKAYKVAPRFFPKLVPFFPWGKETKINKILWEKLCGFDRPFLTIFSSNDPFTKRAEEDFIKQISGAKGQPHLKVKNAGHFIQEDQPELISQHILFFLAQRGIHTADV